MNVVVLYDRVPVGAALDEEDVLVQVAVVRRALTRLGHRSIPVIFSLDLSLVAEELRKAEAEVVFNLVESVEGYGRLVYLAPALLDYMRLPYTGSHSEAIFLTSNKLLIKRMLISAGIMTPPWVSADPVWPEERFEPGRYVIKAVWEHASIGLDEESLVCVGAADELRREMEQRREQLRGECLAERYVEGREFHVSLLAGPNGPEVLPTAEVQFKDYPEGKPRMFGYRAKWEASSFEYQNTERCFDLSGREELLVQRLKGIARKCWNLFGLRGYARIDFRVDNAGVPWVLDVNANPCVSPDSGFGSAAREAGLAISRVVGRLLADALAAKAQGEGVLTGEASPAGEGPS